MSSRAQLSHRIEEILDSTNYQVEDLVLTLTGEFLRQMELTGTSRSELANRLGVKPPRVTRILQGNDNFTLRTVVHVADALGCRLVFTLAPCGAKTAWLHYFDGGRAEATTARVPTAAPARICDYSPSPLSVDAAPIELELRAG
jgi:transcriptional regulator with XRE-family HTH domain